MTDWVDEEGKNPGGQEVESKQERAKDLKAGGRREEEGMSKWEWR